MSQPNNEEWKNAIAIANSSENIEEVTKAEEELKKLRRQYEGGFITPRTYTREAASIWYTALENITDNIDTANRKGPSYQ